VRALSFYGAERWIHDKSRLVFSRTRHGTFSTIALQEDKRKITRHPPSNVVHLVHRRLTEEHLMTERLVTAREHMSCQDLQRKGSFAPPRSSAPLGVSQQQRQQQACVQEDMYGLLNTVMGLEADRTMSIHANLHYFFNIFHATPALRTPTPWDSIESKKARSVAFGSGESTTRGRGHRFPSRNYKHAGNFTTLQDRQSQQPIIL
jgi:hypothetical protein